MNGQTLFERELKIDVAEAKPKQEERPWKKRDSSPAREPSSNSDAPKERPKIALQPRSEAPKPAAPSEVYKNSKSNPFGEAKPRDENEILKKKEEERKQREAAVVKTEQSPKETAQPASPNKSEEKREGSQEREDRKPHEEPFRPATRPKDDRPRRDREDRPRRDDSRRDDRPPRRDDNRGPRRDDRGPRRDDNRRDDKGPRRDDKPRNNNQTNNTTVPAAKRAPWAPKQEEPKQVQSANIFGLLQEEDL